MKSKRGILLPETLKLLIAVACIILLVYLMVSLGGIFVNKTKVDQSNAILDEILGKASALKTGESSSVLITSPKDWYFITYPKGDLSPKLCLGENCICICKTYNEKKPAEGCDALGACKRLKDLVASTPLAFVLNPIPQKVSIARSGEGIVLSRTTGV